MSVLGEMRSAAKDVSSVMCLDPILAINLREEYIRRGSNVRWNLLKEQHG